MNSHTVRCIPGIEALLPLVLLALSVTAHPQAPQSSTEEQTQATQNSQKPASSTKSATKKSRILHFDTSAGSTLVSPRAVELSGQATSSESPAQQNPDQKEGGKSEIVVAPFPISNPAIGSGIVLVGGYLFPLSKKDDTSPNSMIGGGSFYTSSGSWLWGAGTKLYLKEDRFRVTAAYGQAQLHYDLYGIGNSAGNEGLSVPIHQGGKALLLESMIRIKNKLFVGPRFQWRYLDAQVKTANIPPAFNIDPGELKSTTSALGVHLQRDLRNSQFYPTAGTLLDIVGDFFQGNFGSDFSYQSYTFSLNKYSGLTPRQVLAFRVFGCATAGHVPFYDLCLLGMHNDIRGYKAGQYRDRLMLTTQAEYRLQLPKRFGAAAFFGLGEVAPEIGAFNNDNLKPGGGVGIRYMLAKKNQVNLRVDYAVGMQGGGVYLGVTEAF